MDTQNHLFPKHNIDPKKKDAAWHKDFAKAALAEWNGCGSTMFAANNGDYEKFRMYALGKQPVSIYNKLLGVADDNTDWLSIDRSIRAIVSPYRDKVISRLMEQEHGIVATPIDATAHAELKDYYAGMKAKLAVREVMGQVNEELAQHPLIALQSGEPMDLEELEMRVELGEQFNRSKDAELAIELGFHENSYEHFRRTTYEDLFDFGVAGYKEWLGDDNKAKFRKTQLDNVIISSCERSDFKDAKFAGELINVSLLELAALKKEDDTPLFDSNELEELAGSVLEKNGNPKVLGRGSQDSLKAQVLDLEFFSYDESVYKDSTDENGNADFRKAEYHRKSEKYIRKRFEVVRKVKWIVGTDKCYEYGLKNDQKRANDPKNKAKTTLSYKFYAYNFDHMKAQGFMERLIPYLDDYQLTCLKIQNFKNRAVPSGWWIDLDGLERTALNKGGKNMTSLELIRMFMESGVLVGRSQNADGSPAYTNVQPIIPISNTAASELQMFYQDMITIIQSIERMTGYNDVSMGEASAKTLVPGYQMGNMSTQHSLFPLRFAEKQLTQELAYDVLDRMKQGVLKGGVSGYAQALNGNIMRFIAVNPNIASRDYGIMLEVKTSDEQKAWLYSMMQQDIANGFLDTSDAVYIVNTHNVKQAQLIWQHRVKKAKEQMQREKMEQIEATNRGNMEAVQAAAQERLQTMQMQIQADLAKEQMRVDGELQKEHLRIQGENQRLQLELNMRYRMNAENNETKLEVADTANDGKVAAHAIQHETNVTKTQLAGEYALGKQELANQKPQSTTTKK